MRPADPLTDALTRVEELAPAFRALQRISPRSLVAHAADWANTLLACGADAATLIESGTAPGEVRRALGSARQALRDPAVLLPALLELKEALSRQAPAAHFEERVGIG